MASPDEKWKQNVSGKFYVDEQCIACDACVIEAPTFFAMNSEDGHAYVYLAAKTKDEIEKCNNALELCPVAAIGNDGD